MPENRHINIKHDENQMDLAAVNTDAIRADSGAEHGKPVPNQGNPIGFADSQGLFLSLYLYADAYVLTYFPLLPVVAVKRYCAVKNTSIRH